MWIDPLGQESLARQIFIPAEILTDVNIKLIPKQ